MRWYGCGARRDLKLAPVDDVVDALMKMRRQAKKKLAERANQEQSEREEARQEVQAAYAQIATKIGATPAPPPLLDIVNTGISYANCNPISTQG